MASHDAQSDASALSVDGSDIGAWAPDVFGNAMVAESLTGSDLGGLGSLVAEGYALQMAGISGQGDTFSSNAAMLRVMRHAEPEPTQAVTAVAALTSSSGRPLDTAVRERFEAVFDHDFSHVRIHTDGVAQQSAQALHAYAFALGSDIFFGMGQWAPGTLSGDRILSHELTHVVQDDEGRLSSSQSGGGVDVSSPTDATEVEAYGNEQPMLTALKGFDRGIEAGNREEMESAPVVEPDAVGVVSAPASVESAPVAGPAIDQAVASTPEVASPAMADREGSSAAPAPGLALGFIRDSRGAPLPRPIAQRLALLLGHDFGHVRIHTDERAAKAAEALNARAFALGADVFFGAGAFKPDSAEGEQLLAHELTHVAQFDDGRLPGATELEVSNPEQAEEREARAAADHVAEVSSSIGPAVDDMPAQGAQAPTLDSGLALREGDTGSAEEGSTNKVEINLLGRTYEIDLPRVPNPEDVIRDVTAEGLQISGLDGRATLNLRYDSGSQLASGELNVNLAFENLDLGELTFRIDSEGNISARVEGIAFNVGEAVSGTATIELGANDRPSTLQATLTAADFTVGHNLTFSDGQVTLSADTDGRIDCRGTLAGEYTGVGRFEFEVGFEGGQLFGALRLTLDENLQLVEGVTLVRGELEGRYSPEEATVRGSVTLNIRDWAEAEITGDFNPDSGLYNLHGIITQIPDEFQIGEDFAVSNGVIEVFVEESSLTRVEARCDYRIREEYEGDLSATYDVAAQQISGTGNIRMTPDAQDAGIALAGEGGPVMKEMNATLTFEANELQTITGGIRVVVPFEGQDTFDVLGEDLTYNVSEGQVSGTVVVTTMRELTFGSPDATHIVIDEGASATGTVEENSLRRVEGGLTFRVQDPMGEIGTGSISFELPEGGAGINATAELTLTDDYGFPTRQDRNAYIMTGATLTITMSEGALDTATLTQCGFRIRNAEGPGSIEGTVGGTLQFATGQVDGQAHASLVEAWPLEVSWGQFTFLEGGSVDIAIVESTLDTLAGYIPFDLTVASTPAVHINGSLEGSFDKDAGEMRGTLAGALVDPVQIDIDGGDAIVINAGSDAAIDVAGTDITTVRMNLAVDYLRQGDLFLQGFITDGRYEVEPQHLFFNGRLVLMQPIEERTQDGQFGLTVHAGSEVTADVAESRLTQIGGDIQFAVDDGEPLLDGNLTGATIDVQQWLFSGTLDLRTAREFLFPRDGEEQEESPLLQLVVEMGSGVTGTMTDNDLATVQADLNFRVDERDQGELARGGLHGTLNMPEDMYSATGDFHLTRDLVLTTADSEAAQGGGEEGQIESWSLVILTGSGVSGEMNENVLGRAHIEVSANLLQGENRVAEGSLSGDYRLGDTEEGYSGSAAINVVQRIPWHEGDRFSYFVDVGTSLSAEAQRSTLQSASGTFLLLAQEDGQDKVRATVQADYDRAIGITATGTVAVLDDILIRELDEGWSLWLAEGSGGEARVEANDLVYVGGTIILLMRRNGEDTIRGEFNASYDASQGTEAIVNGTGTVTVLADIEMGEVGEYSFTLEGGSNVGCGIANSELEYVEGSLSVRVADGEGDFLRAAATGRYTHGETDFTGQGSLEVTDSRQMVTWGEYQLWLVEGAGAQISIEQMALKTITANIPMRIDDGEGQLIGIQLNGTYDHDAGEFGGSGTATLLRTVCVAEDVAVGDDSYSFYVEEGTTATALVDANDLKEVSGTIIATVHDERGEFIRATAAGTYTRGEESEISVTGTAEVTREKQLVDGDEWDVFLVPGSGARVVVEANDLVEIGGSITTRVDRSSEEFARVSLRGTYTREAGFNGRGSAELLAEFEAGRIGDYTLIVEPGAGAEVEMANSEVTKIGGTIPIRIDEGELQFIRAQVTGDYVVATEAFSGNGSATVLNAKQLAEFAGQQLWLNPGSGATIVVVENELTEITGEVNLSLRDGEGEYVVVRFGGRFDAEADEFTGGGEARVTRRKLLFGTPGEGYAFYLKPGAGASANIERNELTDVGGNVPFVIADETGDLLTGQAEGHYDAREGNFSGTGDVRLARNVDYDVAGGVMLRFLEGSGGGGTVTNNELEELTGTLKVEIHDSDGALIYLEAQGTYDARAGMIRRLEGSMRMLRNFELFDGAIIISGVNGNALVENNELVEAGGGGSVEIVPLNHMTGTFNINYSARGGREQYWGDGQINFTLFDEPDSGRHMGGMIRAEYHRDDTFLIEGNVDYQLNEMIGGTVGVRVDQEMDPAIDATLTINTELVPGRDLFSKEFDLIPRQTIPIYGPIALFFGAKAGMGLEMLPLDMSATIGISDWHPLAREANVPDFDAELALSWGLNFNALAAAYLSLGLSVGVASVSAGIRGEVELNAPLRINPYGRLHGGGDGYWGELGIGITLAPTIDLRVIPFVDAAVQGMDPFVHDFDALEMPLGEIFRFEWGTKYTFGDRPATATEPVVAQDTPPPSQNTEEVHDGPPAVGTGNTEGQTAQNPGGPAVSSSDTESEEGESDDQMAELMETIDKIKIMGEGLGALGELVGLVISLVTAFLTFGPIGLIVMAVWKIFTGELSWDNIVEKVDMVVAAMVTAYELLRPYLPGWLNGIIEAFSGEKPGLLDALFGADDKMRESVGRGEHKYANAEFRGKMISEMISGWCGEADQECILEVLQFSNGNGDFSSVVSHGGGADRIMNALDGAEDTAGSRLMASNGISYSTGW